jgi:hypothetical protein
MDTPRKIAFVHLMRTGGVTACVVLDRVLRQSHRIRTSWAEGLERDWTADEIDRFAACEEPVFVHNHVASWTPHQIVTYRRAGFFLFSFLRPVGDQLCSLYHWLRQREPLEMSLSLDAFLQLQLRQAMCLGIDWRQAV